MGVMEPIPPRLVVDSIFVQYFQSADMPVAPIIHREVFFKQYRKLCIQVLILTFNMYRCRTVVLQLRAELFEYCQPGRMLQADRPKIVSSVQSEFLLTTTVLCFYLNDNPNQFEMAAFSSGFEVAARGLMVALQVSKKM
jgi:hypothetical protein